MNLYPRGTMDATADRVSVIYVIGSSRGGTTRVGRTLGLLSGATFAGELRRLWGPSMQAGRRCGCGEPHDRCEIWSRLLVDGAPFLQPSPERLARLQDRVAPVTRSWWHTRRLLRRGAADQRTPEGRYLRALTDLYEAFARVSETEILVDTSKNLGDAALLNRASNLQTYCLHVVRDPRGVLHTRRILAGHSASSPRPIESIRTAVYWSLVHYTATAVMGTYAEGRSMRITYESFADDPQRSLEVLARFVGTSPPSPELRRGEPFDVPVAHGPDGHGGSQAAQLVLTRDDAWRRELNVLDRFLATVVTYPLLKRFGYPTWRTERS